MGQTGREEATDPRSFIPVKSVRNAHLSCGWVDVPTLVPEVDMHMAWWLGPTVYRAHLLAAMVEWDGPAMFPRAYLQP